MCGNFGLVSVPKGSTNPNTSGPDNNSLHGHSFHNELDASVSASMHEVAQMHGIRYRSEQEILAQQRVQQVMLPPIKILEAQTACTEIRGGQAGGFSSIEYKFQKKAAEQNSRFDAMFGSQLIAVPHNNRVRMVARKRHPLASDLASLYMRNRRGKALDPNSCISVIGHTRFATSSINMVPELHPHEWVPFHDEIVWSFNQSFGRFEKNQDLVGLHISHNGDFDAMECYSSTLTVDDIGKWLERVLHVPNTCRGDSPKIAGCMDLLRTQGRWSASARLAYIRAVLSSATDVTGGAQLSSETAGNTFPPPRYWDLWASVFEKIWTAHINNVIAVKAPAKFDLKKRYTYSISKEGLAQLETNLVRHLQGEDEQDLALLNIAGWSVVQLRSFVHHALRSFLLGDLYTALTELLSRAEGSFGLQVHCTLEPGVVVIASKGQPMSLAFDPTNPLALFGSEAEALAVPVYESGAWLPQRLDLDSKGEIVRIGEPRALQEGAFQGIIAEKKPEKVVTTNNKKSKAGGGSSLASLAYSPQNQQVGIPLDCGLEIRSYSLITCVEASMDSLVARCVAITAAPLSYDPKADLVLRDLQVVPAVLNAIDNAWSLSTSPEYIAGQAFATSLVHAMQTRVMHNEDTTDLLLVGVEVSLWVSEQFAADLRRVFPNLNVESVSANKLLSFGEEHDAGKIFFPTSEEIQVRRMNKNTVILLVSQSGQTFPTLHATRRLASRYTEQVFLLTGCFHSKMEMALKECYQDKKLTFTNNRVLNNYSGHRPAEPTSVAIAATWHTMTRLLLHTIDVSRKMCPRGRLIHPWDMEAFAMILQRIFRRWLAMRRNMKNPQILARVMHSPDKKELKKKQSKKDIDDDSEDEEEHGSGVRFWGDDSKGISKNDSLDAPNHGMIAESDAIVDPKQIVLSNNRKAKSESHSVSIVTPPEHDGRSLSRKLSRTLSMNNGSHNSVGPLTKSRSVKSYKVETAQQKGLHQVTMTLSDGCIGDLKSLISQNLIPNLSAIVGHDAFDHPLPAAPTHDALVLQGRAWAEHINETWTVLILVGVYLILSVGLGLPIIGLIADAILAIIQVATNNALPYGILAFTPRTPHVMYNQGIGYTLLGVFIQFCDAVFFIYVGKNITRLVRLIRGRPLAARHGKRTIVIVDSPAVHQLTEIFVSKLFSQSDSIISVDVHGASGHDHFVHRFTHRVVRGLLIAVGRPDGRLCCLAKSEASVLLAAKQAAFIRNPDYKYEGSGPEIVTVGHNPYVPNLGLAKNIVLHGGSHRTTAALQSAHGREVDTGELIIRPENRSKFVDEYIYDRLFLAKKPFSTTILRQLRRAYDGGDMTIRSRLQGIHHSLHGSLHGGGPFASRSHHGIISAHGVSASAHGGLSAHGVSGHGVSGHGTSAHSARSNNLPDEPLPYGVHHIDPSILLPSAGIETSVFADFVAANMEYLKPQMLQQVVAKGGVSKSDDPAMHLAFASRLDSQTRQVQDLQTIVQQLYECRVASLERYLSFCVMFHAMAAACCHPWLRYPWDIARSQSNLRVATTASPVSAGGGDSHEMSTEIKQVAKAMAFKLRRVQTNF